MAENKRHWLRKESADQTKASFPERFFDLVFVFAVIQLSKTRSEDFSLGIAAEAVLFIFALWCVWIHTTWVMDLLDTEISPVRPGRSRLTVSTRKNPQLVGPGITPKDQCAVPARLLRNIVDRHTALLDNLLAIVEFTLDLDRSNRFSCPVVGGELYDVTIVHGRDFGRQHNDIGRPVASA